MVFNQLTIKREKRVLVKGIICDGCSADIIHKAFKSSIPIHQGESPYYIATSGCAMNDTSPLLMKNPDSGQEEEFGVRFSREKVFAAMDSNRTAAEKKGQALDNIGKGATKNNSDCKHYARSFGDDGLTCKDCGKNL
jgi:hypothetical protein